jgi:2-oxoglutarate-Fe(II)-dependent oxygenase superfamily protein
MPQDPASLLDSLERAMSSPERSPGELRALASPSDLHLAFVYELALLVRQGPVEMGAASPAALLQLAQRTAAAGAVSWSTPGELRGRLARLEARLKEAGAWHPDRPLWWSPLPPATPAEEVWAGLEEGWTAAAPALPWQVYPRLVAPEILEDLAREIEEAHAAGRLRLEPGGIGVANQKAPQRSDEVAYLSGLEPALLDAAPRLAVLLQWLLGRVAGELAESLPDRLLSAPGTAMLARYPAPSAGYRPHLDNPGGPADNGRAFALILYLNPPGRECAGGEIALWSPGARVSTPPAAVLPPRGGSAVLFDVRTVPHQVLPLAPGPPRWSVVLWLQDGRPPAVIGARLSPPELTVTDALQALPDPPLPPDVLLVHELEGDAPGGRIVVRKKSAARPRVGLVATVYRGGAGLDAWCDHHLGLGFDHAVLVFDHLEEPAEAADAARLKARFPEERLTVWSGAEVQAARWPGLPPFPERERLREWAAAGAASFAHAARQALNASAALLAAKTGELGGAPLDWLLHLDADEWLRLEGDGRGGADLHEHFAAAGAAGRALVRYLNHELLLPWQAGSPPRFKLNPRLALARHGPAGWQALVAALRMGQTDPRPWFLGYHNGKSAVAVARGLAAAGVHGWYLAGGPQEEELVAGPSILHLHRPTPEAFRQKYLAVAAAGGEGRPPFAPSPVEEAAVALLRFLAGADPEVVDRELAALYRRLTTFTATELAVLEEAGLILAPEPAPLALVSL